MRKMDEIDKLISFYEEHMPKTVYLQRNGKRYDEIVEAMRSIQDFIATIEDSATYKVSKDELIGTSLSLDVVCTLLSLTEVDQFCDAIKKADSIDITPLTDGSLSIIFGFNDAYIPAPPRT